MKRNVTLFATLALALVMPLILSACTVPQTADDWKAWLETVPALFGIMLAGSIAHGLIQQRDATNNGTPMSFTEYWSYGREIVIALILNAAAFAVLLLSNQLNFAAAFGIGMGVNAFADSFTKNGRSQALTKPEDQR